MIRRVAPLILIALACENPSSSSPDTGAITLSIVSGNGQAGPPHQELPAPLVVQVLNTRGKPVLGRLVNFVVLVGGGSTFAGASETNSLGIAQEYWTLGESGPQQLEARAVDPTTGEKLVFGVFTATAGPCGGNPYVQHSNGLGQSYFDCNPLGLPGNPSTYNISMAVAAAAAWDQTATQSTTTFNCVTTSPGVRVASGTLGTAIWVYTTLHAGRIRLFLPGETLLCPLAPLYEGWLTWN